MMTGGLIVRLIDVVLIILFGFIAISDIQMKRQLRLPGETQEEAPSERTDTAFLVVSIAPSGAFEITLDEQQLASPANLSALRGALIRAADQLKAAGKTPIVIIDPAGDASMQQMVDVFDICEQEKIPKSIDFQIEESSE